MDLLFMSIFPNKKLIFNYEYNEYFLSYDSILNYNML